MPTLSTETKTQMRGGQPNQIKNQQKTRGKPQTNSTSSISVSITEKLEADVMV